MAQVNLFIQGLQMFSDLGVRQSVVQNPRGDDRNFLDTAWTVQALRGGILWVASVVIAAPLAAFYTEPALLWLVPLAGSTALLQGLQSPTVFWCARHVRRGPLVRMEVGVYAVTMTLSLGAVWLLTGGRDAGPALRPVQLAIIVGGAVFSAAAELIVSYTLPGVARPRLRWEPEAHRHLLHFGGWVFLSTACTFLACQADRLFLGKAVSREELGLYHIAAMLAAMPGALLVALGTHLVFPRLSAALRDGRPLADAVRRPRAVLAVLAGFLVTGAAVAGPAFVETVYPARYHPAAGLLPYLAVAVWFTALLNTGELVLLARGETALLAAGQFMRLTALPGLMAAGYRLAGVPGLVLGLAAAEALRYALLAVLVRRAGVGLVGFDALLTAGVALVAVGGLTADAHLRPVLPAWGRFAVEAAGLGVVWAGLAAIVLRAARETVTEVRA
jgi:O-antigen/teichoic acid export membrane protein